MKKEQYKVEVNYYQEGEVGQIDKGIPWMKEVWCTREEMQELPVSRFVENMVHRFQDMRRFEIGVYRVSVSGESKLRAAAVVTFDSDPHVGLVLSVEVAYSAKPGLGKLLRREFDTIARNGGARMLRLVKREGPYRYSVRYTPVKE